MSRPPGVRGAVAVSTVLCLASLASPDAICATAADAAGRWEGLADVPGAPLSVVVDLAPDAQGAWQGSILFRGRGAGAAPLEGVAVDGRGVTFTLASAFAMPIEPAPRMSLALQGDGTLAGRLELAGNSAAVSLHRSGPAQVTQTGSTRLISASLEGVWRGRFELGGYAREVTITLANRAPRPAGGQLVVVGKRTTTLEVDQVVQGRQFVSLRVSAADFGIEGRFDAAAGTITGSMSQGPFEAPIVLHRDAPAKENAS